MALAELTRREITTIADRVGHTDSTFAYKQYGHLFEAQRKAAAVPLDELLKFGDEDAD